MRVLIALGGNAMTGPDGSATPEAQKAAIEVASRSIADVAALGHEVVLTHGNGPQVGNLLVKNELAAHVVPPVPLDWCGAQTQATIGTLLLDALEPALAERGVDRRVAVLVSRTLVNGEDPGFRDPTKPIGRYVTADEAAALIAHGQVWEDRGERGWRRVVASPQPLEVLDAPAVRALLAAGFIVVAAGGGGIPTVRDQDGRVRGVEAVIDKDLTAAVLARALGADVLVIATDVEHRVRVPRLATHRAACRGERLAATILLEQHLRSRGPDSRQSRREALRLRQQPLRCVEVAETGGDARTEREPARSEVPGSARSELVTPLPHPQPRQDRPGPAQESAGRAVAGLRRAAPSRGPRRDRRRAGPRPGTAPIGLRASWHTAGPRRAARGSARIEPPAASALVRGAAPRAGRSRVVAPRRPSRLASVHAQTKRVYSLVNHAATSR